MNELAQYLLASSPAIIYTCKAGGDYGGTYVSANIEELLGYRPEEYLEDSAFWKEHVHPDDLERILAGLEAVLIAGHHVCEYRFLAKNGEYRWMHDELRLIRNATTGVDELVGSWLDITERKRSEEKLKHSQELMKYIIEHTRSAVAVHDRELKYIYVSQRYLDDYNVRESNIIGKHHYEVFPDLPQKWRDVHQRVLAGEVLSAEEDDYVRADGSVDWTRWECRPWYEADGSIGGIIVYTEVITERKRAEESLRDSESFAREAARIARLGRWRWNIPTGAAEWSTVTREIFGLTAPERQITYADFINAVHPDDRSSVETAVRNALDHDREYVVEHRILLADGSLRYVQEKGEVHRDGDGKPVRMVGTVLDVTEQKRVEECLRENDRIKSEFIATAAHELRTPLAVIQGYAELILGGDTPVDPQHLGFLKIIHDKALVLEKIVDELLDVSRMESGRLVCLEFAPVDIVEVLRQVVAHFEKEATGHRFSLVLPDAPVHLVLDGMKINQVLENLLSNAVKFSPAASEIVVTAGLRENCFEVTVADKGAGLTPENQQRVFEKFFRADATNTSKPGLGLGLYLVKKIIEAHRGKVWLDSIPGQGTQFYFCLPLQGGTPGDPAC